MSNPGPDTPLRAGVTIIAIGARAQLEGLDELVAAREPARPARRGRPSSVDGAGTDT